MSAFSKITIASILCMAGCAVQPSGDSALASRLLGKWSAYHYLENGSREQSIELRSDGTFLMAGALRNARGTRSFLASGTWRVQNGNLIFETTQTEGPSGLTQAKESHRVVSISDWELVTTDGDTGREERAWRYPK